MTDRPTTTPSSEDSIRPISGIISHLAFCCLLAQCDLRPGEVPPNRLDYMGVALLGVETGLHDGPTHHDSKQ